MDRGPAGEFSTFKVNRHFAGDWIPRTKTLLSKEGVVLLGEKETEGLPGFIHPRVLGIPTISFE